MSGAILLGARAGLAYGALGLPLAFLALPLYVNLPSHYTQRHGVPLATLGAVLLATRALDALLDPFIGQAIDRVFARSMQAAWWLAGAAAAVVGAGFVALFFAPFDSGPALLAWLAVGLVVTYLAYSVLAVLHQAWGTRLGGDARQRSRVAAWREGCGLVGVLLASVLPALAGLGTASVVLAAALALGVALLGRAPRGEAQTAGTATADWRLPWRNRAFRGLLAAYMLNGIASAVPATLLIFFVQDRLQASAWTPAFLAAYFAAGVVSMPLWLRGVRRFGLVPSWLAGMLLAVAAFIGAYPLGPGSQVAFVAVCIASGLALGADLALPGALLTGLVQRAGHAARAEGVYAGWWTSATKINLGLAAGLALPLLALAGYVPGTRDATSLQALALAYVVVPCLLKLLAAAALWRWRRPTSQGDA